ncbi:hypothetical protein CDAR_266531, partial [Caerostris darwini]
EADGSLGRERERDGERQGSESGGSREER